MHVITVEGIGNTRDGLHPVQARCGVPPTLLRLRWGAPRQLHACRLCFPAFPHMSRPAARSAAPITAAPMFRSPRCNVVQERLARAHGSQCGFCTPGFVMSMVALLRSKAPQASSTGWGAAVGGSRCTGAAGAEWHQRELLQCQAGGNHSLACAQRRLACCRRRRRRRRLKRTWRATCGQCLFLFFSICFFTLCYRLSSAAGVVLSCTAGTASARAAAAGSLQHARCSTPRPTHPTPPRPTTPAAAAPATGPFWMPSKRLQRRMRQPIPRKPSQRARQAAVAAQQRQQQRQQAAAMALEQQTAAALPAAAAAMAPQMGTGAATNSSGCAPALGGLATALPASWTQPVAPSLLPASTRGRPAGPSLTRGRQVRWAAQHGAWYIVVWTGWPSLLRGCSRSALPAVAMQSGRCRRPACGTAFLSHRTSLPPPAVEPIFPPELRRRRPAELALPGPRCTWYRPLTLERLLALKAQHPEAKLVVGNTGGQRWGKAHKGSGGAVCGVLYMRSALRRLVPSQLQPMPHLGLQAWPAAAFGQWATKLGLRKPPPRFVHARMPSSGACACFQLPQRWA